MFQFYVQFIGRFTISVEVRNTNETPPNITYKKQYVIRAVLRRFRRGFYKVKALVGKHASYDPEDLQNDLDRF